MKSRLYVTLYIFFFFLFLSLPSIIYPGEFKHSTLDIDIAIQFFPEEKLIKHKRSLSKRTKHLLKRR